MPGAKNNETAAAAPTGSISSQILSEGRFSGIFAGWGASRVVALQALPDSGHQESTVSVIGDTSNTEKFERKDVKVKGKHAHGLSTLSSVSIAGSDIMSSCLYTAGICAYTSGKLAPLALFSVTIMLFFFRRVYSETVSAMPVNGGTYNLMLNTTNKKWAAFVACLSILSYMATAIISAYDAVVYLKLLWPDVDMRLFTCVIILVFAVVALCGVGESAAVATPILLTHIAIVSLLIVWGFAYGIQDGFSIFYHNTQTEFPTIVNSSGHTLAHRSGIGAMYFGYCSGLLGITGFESAANFVEEMKSSKVFVETVNWMWGLVGFYNPMISLVAMMVLPLDTIYEHSGDMLAIMADKLGGERFRAAVCVDATIILCGAVLTSFIGIAGLLRRLAADSILPQALAIEDSRGTPSVAIIVFLVLSLSLFLAIYDPSNEHAIEDFGGVYAIAFLSVLVCFAMAAVMLKLYRPYLARRVVAKWWQVFCSLICVTLGFLGNIILAPKVFYLFLAYLSGFIGLVALMFGRVEVLSIMIWMLRRILMTGKTKTNDPNSQEDRIIPAVHVQEQYSETDALLQGDEMDQIMYMLSSPDGHHPIAAAAAVVVGAGTGGSQKNGDYFMLQASSSRRQSKNSENLDLEADTGAVVPGLDAPNPNGESWKDSTRSDDPAHPPNEVEMTTIGGDAANNSNVLRSDSNRINARQNRSSFTQSTANIFSWAENVVEQVRTRRRTGSITSVGSAAEAESSRKKTQRRRESTFRTELRTYRSNSVVEMDRIIMRRSLTSRVLNYCMKRLDDMVSEPFVYLCKGPDPVAVHLALEYITNNEVTNQIYVVHFVDDRQAMQMNNRVMNAYKAAGKRHPRPSDPAVGTEQDDNDEVMVKHQQKGTALMLRMFTEKHPEAGHDEKGADDSFDLDHALRMMPSKAKQLIHLVHIIDTFYTYKKITCVVVRGMFFCPRAVQAALKYMKCSSNNMIMGVPDTTFPFQPAQLGGVRIVVPDSNPTLRRHTYHHLREALRESLDLYTPHNRRSSINPRRNSADLDAVAEEEGEEYDPGMFHHPHDMYNDGDLHSDDEYELAHPDDHHDGVGGAAHDVEGQLFPHWDYHPDHPTEYPKPPTAAEEKAAIDAQAKNDANNQSPNASSTKIVAPRANSNTKITAPRANSNANFISAVRGISSAMFDL